jgi:type I restriction enzyme S subunit
MTTATQKIPSGYKQTEIGMIPADWDVKRLGDIGRSIIGLTYSPHDVVEYGKLVHRSSNIQNNKLAYGDNVYVSKQIPEDLILRENDILICVRNGSRDLIGKSGLIKGKSVGETFGAFMSVFRSDEYQPFIFYLILSSLVQRQISQSLGATINQITNKTLNSFEIPYPQRLEERKAIAQALSNFNSLTEILEKLIEKKKNLKQGVAQELLTGKKRLPGFSRAWENRNLGSLAKIKTGSRNNQDKIENGKYPFFVRSSTVERIDSYSYDCEAILVPGEGNIGNIFHYINGRFDVHQRVYAITNFIEDVSGKFIYYYMAKNFGAHAMQNTVKATVDSLRLPTFENFELLIPPRKEEQTAIADVLSDMDSEIEKLESQLSKYQNIKQGIMQTLLTGKIRLK